MHIIRETAITDAMIVSSNVPENDYPEWDGTSTSYSINDSVIVTTAGVHKVYTAAAAIPASGSNLSPELDVLDAVPQWLEVGPTNRMKMFVGKIGEKTTNPTSIVVRVTPGSRVDSIGLLNVAGSSARIRMIDPTDGVVFDQTDSLLDNSAVASWYTYFNEPIIQKNTLIMLDLPPYGTADIEITIESATTASCDLVVMGLKKEIGGVRYGAGVGIDSFSRKKTNEFGVTTIIAGPFIKKLKCMMSMPESQSDDVFYTLAKYDSTAALFVGVEKYTSTIIYGFCSFEVLFSHHSMSECSLDVTGII